MRRFLHPVRTRLAGEGGFTMIELMAALLVLVVGIVSVAELTTNQMSQTLYSRERDVAIGEANKQVESLRSTSFVNLQLNPDALIPASYTDDDGTVYSQTGTINKILVASASNTAYVNYQQSVNVAPFTFNVKTLIAAVDDSADGIGAADQNTNTVDYKKVILMVASTDKTAFTYKVETIVRDTSNDPVTPVQGLRIKILDTDGNLVSDDLYGDLNWTIDITGAGVDNESVDEGQYENFALVAGTYTCTINNTESTRDWKPQTGQAGHTVTNTSDSFPCTVTSGQINDALTSVWVQPQDCEVVAGQNGDLTVNVVDNNGGGIVGATVDPAPTGGQAVPAAQTTGSLGGTTFSQIPTGPYNLTVSATGYTTKSGIQACVTVTQGDPVAVSLALTLPNSPTVNVTIKYTGGGTKTWRVYLSDSIVVSQDISKNQIKTFTFTPAPGTYFVHVYCVPGNKENLREALENQTFLANTSYWYPGPGVGTQYTEPKC